MPAPSCCSVTAWSSCDTARDGAGASFSKSIRGAIETVVASVMVRRYGDNGPRVWSTSMAISRATSEPPGADIALAVDERHRRSGLEQAREAVRGAASRPAHDSPRRVSSRRSSASGATRWPMRTRLLVAEGWFESRHGAGTWVAERPDAGPGPDERRARLRRAALRPEAGRARCRRVPSSSLGLRGPASARGRARCGARRPAPRVGCCSCAKSSWATSHAPARSRHTRRGSSCAPASLMVSPCSAMCSGSAAPPQSRSRPTGTSCTAASSSRKA